MGHSSCKVRQWRNGWQETLTLFTYCIVDLEIKRSLFLQPYESLLPFLTKNRIQFWSKMEKIENDGGFGIQVRLESSRLCLFCTVIWKDANHANCSPRCYLLLFSHPVVATWSTRYSAHSRGNDSYWSLYGRKVALVKKFNCLLTHFHHFRLETLLLLNKLVSRKKRLFLISKVEFVSL